MISNYLQVHGVICAGCALRRSSSRCSMITHDYNNDTGRVSRVWHTNISYAKVAGVHSRTWCDLCWVCLEEVIQPLPAEPHEVQPGRQSILEQHTATHGPAIRQQCHVITSVSTCGADLQDVSRALALARQGTTAPTPKLGCIGSVEHGIVQCEGGASPACLAVAALCHCAAAAAAARCLQTGRGTHCAVSAATCSPTPRKAAISSMDSSAQLQHSTQHSIQHTQHIVAEEQTPV